MSACLDTRRAAGHDSRRVLTVAAVTYVLAWLVGLVAAPPRPTTADGAVLAGFVRDHAGALAVQSLLVHGVAGAALLVVAVQAGRVLRSQVSATTGVVAAVLSFVQAALLAGAGVAATRHADVAVVGLLGAIDGVDALKLVLLAGFVVASTRAGRRARVIPTWVSLLGALTAGLLVIGAVSFLPGLGPLGPALVAALPLLLLYVATLSLLVARRSSVRRTEVDR